MLIVMLVFTRFINYCPVFKFSSLYFIVLAILSSCAYGGLAPCKPNHKAGPFLAASLWYFPSKFYHLAPKYENKPVLPYTYIDAIIAFRVSKEKPLILIFY